MKTIINNIILSKKEGDGRTPIKRGCFAAANGGCFCTGACEEIVGHIEANGEKTFLKCHHGNFLNGFPCEKCKEEKQDADLFKSYIKKKE